MKKTILAAALISALPFTASAEGTFTTPSMTPETALKLATAALEACRVEGYQVAISVVDRAGIEQVMLRDRFAGPHTPTTAWRKAWTAVSFRTNTSDLLEVTGPGQAQSGVRHLENVLIVGGGMVVNSGGEMVGGIGVSGAPGGELDDGCAAKGIEAVEDILEF